MLLYNPGIHKYNKCIKYSYSSDIPKLNKYLISMITTQNKLFSYSYYHINEKDLFLHKDRATEIYHMYYGVIPTLHIIISTYTYHNLSFISNHDSVYDIQDGAYFRRKMFKVPFVSTEKFLDSYYACSHFTITRKCLKIKLGSLGVSLEHHEMQCRKRTVSNFKGAKR